MDRPPGATRMLGHGVRPYAHALLAYPMNGKHSALFLCGFVAAGVTTLTAPRQIPGGINGDRPHSTRASDWLSPSRAWILSD